MASPVGSMWHAGTSSSMMSCSPSKIRGVVTADVANLALVSLLPRHVDGVEVKVFAPISLIHCVAKLVAKRLSSRLPRRMPKIVGPHQSAFICVRCLRDHFQLVHYTARKLHAPNRDVILLKLDITKPFHTVD
jgi:hypothetical protein